MQLRNVSPLGHLDVPLLDRDVIEPGEVFDVTAEQANRLLVTDVNFEPVDDEAKAIRAELVAAEQAAPPLAYAGQPVAPQTVEVPTSSAPVVDQPTAPPAVNDGITGGPNEGENQ